MSIITRRNFTKQLFVTASLATTTSLTSISALADGAIMDAPTAKKLAESNEIILVDVRSPQEWKQTGIAEAAHPISIHEKGFLAKLDRVMKGDKSKKVAFICATGARSAAVQKELLKRGYTNAISVAEGMLGGRHGKGWIPRGMPIKQYKAKN